MVSNGHDIIRAGYAAGDSVADIACLCESTPGSVKVIAHRLGLKHQSLTYWRVPQEDRASYRYFLRAIRLPAAQAAALVGVVQ